MTKSDNFNHTHTDTHRQNNDPRWSNVLETLNRNNSIYNNPPKPQKGKYHRGPLSPEKKGCISTVDKVRLVSTSGHRKLKGNRHRKKIYALLPSRDP